MSEVVVLARLSSQRTGEHYEIRRVEDGSLACTCQGFLYSRLTPPTCKHLGLYNDDVLQQTATLPFGPAPVGPVDLTIPTSAGSALRTAPRGEAVVPPYQR